MALFPNPRTPPPRHRAWATGLLVLMCLAGFALELSVPEPQTWLEAWGLVPGALRRVGGWPGVVTHLFLHGGLWHLLGNLLFLWAFGSKVEGRVGFVPTLGLFVLCGSAAGLVHAAADWHSTQPLVGASGAISGLMGAALWLTPRQRIRVWIPIPVQMPVAVFVVAWGAWQVVEAFVSLQRPAHVAFFAHVGGLFAGFCVAAVRAR